jgi:hypothetical protein
LGAIAHIQLIQNPIDMGFNSTFTDAQSSHNIFQTACFQGATIAPKPLQANVFALQTHFIK